MDKNNANNVSTGKPVVGGGIYVAPLGTALPTDAKTGLNTAFNNLGYCSDDGVTNTNPPDTDNIKAWGGDTVGTINKSRDDKFKFTLIEIKNVTALKMVYGNENVSGDLETGITVKANSSEREHHAIVIDQILSGGDLKRIVIPNGSMTDLGDIEYKDGDPINYEVTVAALPDASGNTHYEYIIKKGV